MPRMNEGVVGERILRNFEFLKKIATTKSMKKRWHLVQNATRDELLSIVEVCSNILSYDFILTNRQREKILPYAELIRKLSRTRRDTSARKIVQKGEGSFFSALLIPVLIEAARLLAS